MDAEQREADLELRKGYLILVRAIERKHQTATVTVTLKREEAKRLGLIDCPQ